MMAARTSKREFILHRAIGTDLDHPGATRRPASRDESKDRHVLDPVAQTQWRPSQLIRNNVLVTAIACEPGPAITIEHHTVGNPGIRQVAGVMVFFTNQPFSRNVAWPRLSPSPTPPPPAQAGVGDGRFRNTPRWAEVTMESGEWRIDTRPDA
jgi:hypothetical protein